MVWPLSFFTDNSSLVKPLDYSKLSQTVSNLQSSSLPAPVMELLQYFEAPGTSLPPSARVGDPKLKQRESQPLRIWNLWKYGAFAAVKAGELATALVSHHLRGPLRKSWGIEMTLLTCIMRDIGRHSHLADIATVRMLMSIGGLAPVPSDALVTPVTFRVRKRALKGILAKFDALEDGSRELSGEWVVGKKTWQRLQQEWKTARKNKVLSGNEQTRISSSKRKEIVILYLHGGAYYLSSPATHRLLTIPLSKYLDARLFAVDYRLAPETRFPGPLHDAVSAYFRLIDELHIPPENIIIAGDSAGGGLSVALMMYLRDNRYPLPGGGILISPWVDLTMSCDSWDSNAQYDVIPMPQPGDHMNPIACYLGEHMEKYLTHPYASPLFGDLSGLPPLLIQAGDAEVLRDEITLLAHKASSSGVEVRHELYEDAVHVFQTFPFLEQARRAFMSARGFTRDILLSRHDSIQSKFEVNVEETLEREIDTQSSHVVRGDGTESNAGKEEILVAQSRRSSWVSVCTGGHDSSESSQSEEDSSWVTPGPSPWPSPPPSPPPEKSASHVRHPQGTFSSKTARNSVNRDRSESLSSMYSFSTLSSHPSSTSSSLRRVQSKPHVTHTHDPSSSHPPSKEYRLPSLPIASDTRPPRPSIRRSHGSHPDITTLCQQWARSGPANHTVTYKADTIARKRKHSSSVSSSSSRLYN